MLPLGIFDVFGVLMEDKSQRVRLDAYVIIIDIIL